MRFMAILKATAASEAGTLPKTEDIAAVLAFNEELVKAGILLAADGLKPELGRCPGAVLGQRADGHRRAVRGDQGAGGRLLDPRGRLVGGGVEWFKRCPNTTPDEEWEIEIRQFPTADDFGEALTPQQRELGARLEATAAEQHG